ncbi:flavin-containing superfamily amine oxidase-like protein [Bisporella sp. PMI_857]|nr:flavin-containing superfamily amine oxidase-like protein [Bisporella sp. PMI_857]
MSSADCRALYMCLHSILCRTVIERDVTIVGGGSSGTYAAIRLTDLGNTIAIVEQKDYLGGHTETYHDPQTGDTIDIGVVVWHNVTLVKNYFKRLNVSIGQMDWLTTPITRYVDFRTGHEVLDYVPSNFATALAAYREQLSKYPYVEKGFDLVYPVPVDLLLSFGEFAEKYKLQDMINFVFGFAQGLGDLLAQPTLYVFKNFGTEILNSIVTGFLTTTHKDNSKLYEHATAELEGGLFLSSKILSVERSQAGTRILVETPAGLVLINSKKLLFTIPPNLDNLEGWDLTRSEKRLFAQFRHSAYYTGLVKNTGIPDNVTVVNTGSNTLYNIPILPGLYRIQPSGTPGLMAVKFGSALSLSDEEVREEILSSIKKLSTSGKEQSCPELVVYSSHTPFEMTVPAEAIASGFYRDLGRLQGQKQTFYTGAAFHTHDSSMLWEYIEAMLPKITAA